MDTKVKVQASWSHKQGAIGTVVRTEGNDIIVNFGNPAVNYRFSTFEVETVDNFRGST